MKLTKMAACPCWTLFRQLVKAGLLLGLWVDRAELERVATELRRRERVTLDGERWTLQHEGEEGWWKAGADRDRDLSPRP